MTTVLSSERIHLTRDDTALRFTLILKDTLTDDDRHRVREGIIAGLQPDRFNLYDLIMDISQLDSVGFLGVETSITYWHAAIKKFGHLFVNCYLILGEKFESDILSLQVKHVVETLGAQDRCVVLTTYEELTDLLREAI